MWLYSLIKPIVCIQNNANDRRQLSQEELNLYLMFDEYSIVLEQYESTQMMQKLFL